LAFVPPRAKLCPRCGNPAPAALAPVPLHESAGGVDPPAGAPEAPAPARSPVLLAAGLGAIALFLALVYASC
jgi:hypothetical protein